MKIAAFGILAGLVIALLFVAVFNLKPKIVSTVATLMDTARDLSSIKTSGTEQQESGIRQISLAEARGILSGVDFFNAVEPAGKTMIDGTTVVVQSTLSPFLQSFIQEKLSDIKTLTRGKPQRIALVAMDPISGRLLAMSGFDLDDPHLNTCTITDYPAASLFKIVTAAAAIETKNLKPETPLHFNGGKYTLYKRQLKDTQNRYTSETSLEKAFAESINPVFGKLAANTLGKEILATYADRFGFNRVNDTDLVLDTPRVVITDETFQWAEVGCGFNTTTTISPVQAVMMSSSVLNYGNMPMPTLVDEIKTADGETIYKYEELRYNRVISPETALSMIELMKRTVAKGTARSAFRGSSKDPVLSRLILGGKTGSLYNAEHTVKYDLFTGFGREINGTGTLAVAAIVGHRKYIGTRAAQFGRMMIETYFSNYFSEAGKTTQDQ